MDNNKKLTPEEILRNNYPFSTRHGISYTEFNALQAMKQYAAQEVSEAKENETWAHDQLQHKKDALLKEAIMIIRCYMDATDRNEYGKVDNFALDFIKRTIEEHGKDKLQK